MARRDIQVQGFVRHYRGSYFQIAEQGRFSVELVTQPERLKAGANHFDLIVHNHRNEDVEGAQVRAEARRSGTTDRVVPGIREVKGGVYSIRDLTLNHGGDWELVVHVEKDGEEDSVVFVLQVGEAGKI